MKTFEEITKEQKELHNTRNTEKDRATEKQDNRMWLMSIVQDTARDIKRILMGVLRVEVQNEKDLEPPIRDVEKAIKDKPDPKEVAVNNLEGLTKAIKEVEKKVSEIEFPEIPETEIPDTIKVNNLGDIKVPKMPEIPDKVEVKNVNDFKKEINKLEKAIKNIKIPEVKIPEQKDRTDELLKSLEGLENSINGIEVPEAPEMDTEGLKNEMTAVKEAIQNIKFPLPQFTSSWQHSLTMQSEDLAKSITYKSVNGKEKIDYIEFTGVDGNIYRKTYSYTGSGKLSGWTKWVQQ